MNDEQFGTIERNVDSWIGEIPFVFPCAGTKTLRFCIRAGEVGPNVEQRQVIEGLIVRYEKLWPIISAKLKELRSGKLDLISDQLPKSRLLLSIPGLFDSEVFDFELGYEFDDEEVEGTGYFLGFSEWVLKVAVTAS